MIARQQNRRLAGWYILLVTVFAGLYSYVAVRYAANYLSTVYQALNWSIAEKVATDITPLIEPRLREEDVRRAFFEFGRIRPGVGFFLVDANGQVLVSNAAVVQRHIPVEPIRAFLTTKGFPNEAILNLEPSWHDQKKQVPFSAAAVMIAGKPGYVYLALENPRWKATYGMLGDNAAVIGGGVLLLSILVGTILLGVVVFHLLTLRFQRMTQVVQRFKRGDYQARIEDATPDEIGEHSRAFDEMADAIVSNIEELQQIEAVRKEMVSHLAHDLRLPVSVMQTSLELQLLDYDSMSDAERRELLQRALNNCRMLSQMLSQLFEISKLESVDHELNCEEFSIDDLVQDTVINLKAAATAKQVFLELDIDDSLPLVSADIDLMERVLANLIENAIRYTPSGGEVQVAAKRVVGGVRVTVSDSGIGIPLVEQESIFERFFRASNARKHAKDGSGLGLALVKRIVERHRAELHVRSIEGEGSSFWFELPGTEVPVKTAGG